MRSFRVIQSTNSGLRTPAHRHYERHGVSSFILPWSETYAALPSPVSVLYFPHAFSAVRPRDSWPLRGKLSQRRDPTPWQAVYEPTVGLHVVRQYPRVVRYDPDCVLDHFAGPLPRVRELD